MKHANTPIVFISHTLLIMVLQDTCGDDKFEVKTSNVVHLNCGSEDLCGILQLFGLEEAQDRGLHSVEHAGGILANGYSDC